MRVTKRVLSFLLCVCLICSLVPYAFAAGEDFTLSYSFDNSSYQKGDEIKATVVLTRNDISDGEQYKLRGFTFDIRFPDLNLEYVERPVSDCGAIDDSMSITPGEGMLSGTKEIRLSLMHFDNSEFNLCEKTTNIATLVFKAKEAGNINLKTLTDSATLLIAGSSTIKPTLPQGDISINGGGSSAQTYKISFARGGATSGSDPAPVADQKENDVFTVPACSYEWEHHRFIGWSDGNSTVQPGNYTMPGHDVTFTAQWEQYEYKVTFEGGDGTTGTPPTEKWWEPGNRILPTKNTLEKTGYTFEGWSYNGMTYKDGATFPMSSNDVTFTAVWKEIDTPNPTPSPGGSGSGSGGVTSYSVTVNSPANGTVAADKKSAASGATVTITVTPETGYKVGTVTVKDKNGKTIAATEKDGKYSFQMPASAVSVDVTFVKDGQSSVGDCPKDSTCPVDPFKDTANNAWWHDGIHYCVQQGLMNGVASDQFAPNGTTTRAMIVTILWRMEGSPATSYGMSFTDVPAGQWYTEAIRWAQSTGVVTGYDAKTFGPNDNVTREQLAAILYRYTAHKGGDVSKRSTLAQFTDVNQISSWALENIQWANAVGMVNGRTDTTIVPKGNATRAEAASMIQRFCQNVLKL